jgi:hypothetical protein
VPGHIVASNDDTLTVSFRDSSRDTFTKKGRTLTGDVASVSDDALLVLTSEGQPPVRVPRRALLKLEVSEERSRKGRGALIGAGVGLAAALALAAIAAASSDDEDIVQLGYGAAAAGLSLFFVPGGAAVGAIAAPGERWAPVKFDDGGFEVSLFLESVRRFPSASESVRCAGSWKGDPAFDEASADSTEWTN